MRKLKSVRSLWWPHSLLSVKNLLSAGASSGHGQTSCSQAAAAGEVSVVAVAALLPVVHLLQVSDQQTTFSASGFALTLFQTVAVWSRAVTDPRARRDSSHGVQSSNFPICPICLQSMSWQPNHSGDVLCPALSPTSTGIPAENISAWCLLLPQRAQSQPCPAWAQLLTLSQTREWFSDPGCRLGQIPLSLFTVSCAVGSYSPMEINGIMNTN